VDRARDTGDRRRVTVTPTAAGRSMLAEIQSDTRNVQEDLLAPLAEGERAQLEDMLRRVYAHINHEADGQRPSR
jgi:DNA-binding MarR family transcriptional regulator